MDTINDLQKTLGIAFHDPSLLKLALVHSSYINENPGIFPGDNERLEFLGDAILGYFVAEKLYLEFPEFSEGKMTRLRSAVVRRETLARIASAIKLGDFLYMGKGEESGGGRKKTANLAGAMEAVIAAAFLDRGLPATKEIVLRLIKDELAGMVRRGIGADDKSQLQELVQSRWHTAPEYRLVAALGPEHNRTFEIEVVVDNNVVGTGTGKSKKLAETDAARAALEKLSRHFTE